MSFGVDLDAIGQRIESLRGGMSQADFADRLGVDRKTVGTWEHGERLLDTRALLGLWSEFSADPAWVLTGKGFAPTTTEDERELLALYRTAPLTGKMAAVGALQGVVNATQPAPPRKVVIKTGNVVKGNQQSAGINTGVMLAGNLGSKRKKKD